MDRMNLESLLIDYIDGQLNETDRNEVEREIAENDSSRKLYEQLRLVMNLLDKSPELEPAAELKMNFEKALQAELRPPLAKQVFLNSFVFRAVAAVLLVTLGVGIGYWVNKNQQQQSELASLRKEMEATKKMMIAMLDNQQSASQRVLGATAAYHIEKPDDQVVGALVKAMNEDPNTNVRLAALEALGKFNQQESVRKALVSSLSTQKDPVVQIALIQLMVQMKEKDVVKDLEKITNDVHAIKAVKDEAYSGILKLS
jgi:anti-sigma factor RsiW